MNDAHYLKQTVARLQELITHFSTGTGLSSNITHVNSQAVNVGTGNASTGTLRVQVASDQPQLVGIESELVAITDCIDIANNHLEVDTNAINGVTMQVGAGNLEISPGVSGVQRMCIATDDVNLSAINTNVSALENLIIDRRLNATPRFKTCGGFTLLTKTTNFTPIVSQNLVITDFSPPIANMFVVSSSVDDDVGGTGAEQVQLIYIDKNEAQQTATVSLDGLTNVPIGTDVRELISFKCTAWGASGKNAGSINLCNDNDNKIAAQIFPEANTCLFQGIEIPQNGRLMLQYMNMTNGERNNPGTDNEFQIILVTRSEEDGYNYNVLFYDVVTYYNGAHSVDLSGYPILYGSGDPDINMAVYPCLKSTNGGGFDSYGAVYLSALAFDT